MMTFKFPYDMNGFSRKSMSDMFTQFTFYTESIIHWYIAWVKYVEMC